MQFWFSGVSRLAILLIPLWLIGCNLNDVAYYKGLWETLCRESQTTAFEAINTSTTCNGIPLLIAAAQLNDTRLASQATYVLDYLVREFKLNPNVQSPNTGFTAAMVAIDAQNLTLARELILRSDISIRDSQGRTLLHHLAASNWTDYTDLILSSNWLAALAYERSPNTPSPMDIAIQRHNTGFIWRVVLLTNNAAPLANLDTSFLLDKQAERGLSILDALGARALEPSADGYSLLHFAAEKGLFELLRYLLEKGADPSQRSARGSPLALSLGEYIKTTDSAKQTRLKRTIEWLLHSRQAMKAKDTVPALMRAGRIEWIQRAIQATLPIYSYDSLLLQNSESNSGFQQSLLACFATEKVSTACREMAAEGLSSPANAANQNAAHYFYALVSPEFYGPVTGAWVTDGFSWFTSYAAAHGLLDQPDILGNLPIHYWLASPSRRSTSRDSAESRRLAQLLTSTSQILKFNANHDSVLSLAVMNGRVDLVRTILFQKPETRQLIDVPNLLGRSPLSMARESGSQEMYEALVH